MNEIKSFVVGFSLSLLGISLYTQNLTLTPNQTKKANQNIKISLFKDSNVNISSPKLVEIKKQTLLADKKETPILAKDTSSLAYNIDDVNNIDGIEDDEILNINTDDIIPVEFNSSSTIKNAKLSTNDEEIKVAYLPEEASMVDDFSSPWVIAKGSKHIKNKKLLEEAEIKDIKLSDNTISKEDDNLSFEVAERIKQSIIFPIPEEILSDENLTPTFIKKTTNTTAKSKNQEPVLFEKKDPIKDVNEEASTPSILDNISSWFEKKQEEPKESKKARAVAPVYNSQPANTQEANTATISENIKQTKMKDIGDLYEAMQETNSNKKITPTELRLSFNTGRAEISGQTLRWLKAFSEKAINEGYILQIRLDASASTDLQRKRLGLLYTIFTNNGVDVNTIDTAFSNIESDTFIIRTIKNNLERMEN